MLLLANYPVLCDTVALFASILRPDLRVIARDRPCLRALPHTPNCLDLLPDDLDERAGITRVVARHLCTG